MYMIKELMVAPLKLNTNVKSLTNIAKAVTEDNNKIVTMFDSVWVGRRILALLSTSAALPIVVVEERVCSKDINPSRPP